MERALGRNLCDFIGHTVIQRPRLKRLAADKANVCDGFHSGLQPGAGNVGEIQSHMNFLQHPGGGLCHVTFDTAHQERVFVDPGSTDDQLVFFAFRLQAENMAIVAVDRIRSKIGEGVVLLVKSCG